METFNKLEAIEYLVKNAVRGSEWQEAGMFHGVVYIVISKKDSFSKNELDDLILIAEKN